MNRWLFALVAGACLFLPFGSHADAAVLPGTLLLDLPHDGAATGWTAEGTGTISASLPHAAGFPYSHLVAAGDVGFLARSPPLPTMPFHMVMSYDNSGQLNTNSRVELRDASDAPVLSFYEHGGFFADVGGITYYLSNQTGSRWTLDVTVDTSSISVSGRGYTELTPFSAPMPAGHAPATVVIVTNGGIVDLYALHVHALGTFPDARFESCAMPPPGFGLLASRAIVSGCEARPGSPILATSIPAGLGAPSISVDPTNGALDAGALTMNGDPTPGGLVALTTDAAALGPRYHVHSAFYSNSGTTPPGGITVASGLDAADRVVWSFVLGALPPAANKAALACQEVGLFFANDAGHWDRVGSWSLARADAWRDADIQVDATTGAIDIAIEGRHVGTIAGQTLAGTSRLAWGDVTSDAKTGDSFACTEDRSGDGSMAFDDIWASPTP